MTNGLTQHITVEESTSIQWVKAVMPLLNRGLSPMKAYWKSQETGMIAGENNFTLIDMIKGIRKFTLVIFEVKVKIGIYHFSNNP